MPAADLVIQGTVLTVNELKPTAEALAVSDGRIVAVGDRSDVESWIGPETQTIDLGDGCVMPGFVEAHGHPLMEAIVLSDRRPGSPATPRIRRAPSTAMTPTVISTGPRRRPVRCSPC